MNEYKFLKKVRKKIDRAKRRNEKNVCIYKTWKSIPCDWGSAAPFSYVVDMTKHFHKRYYARWKLLEQNGFMVKHCAFRRFYDLEFSCQLALHVMLTKCLKQEEAHAI